MGKAPNVQTIERDASLRIEAPTGTLAATVVHATKGPINKRINITSSTDYVKKFGKPDDVNFKYWWTSNAFLDGSSSLEVVRIEDVNKKCAGVTIGKNEIHNFDFDIDMNLTQTGVIVSEEPDDVTDKDFTSAEIMNLLSGFSDSINLTQSSPIRYRPAGAGYPRLFKKNFNPLVTGLGDDPDVTGAEQSRFRWVYEVVLQEVGAEAEAVEILYEDWLDETEAIIQETEHDSVELPQSIDNSLDITSVNVSKWYSTKSFDGKTYTVSTTKDVLVGGETTTVTFDIEFTLEITETTDVPRLPYANVTSSNLTSTTELQSIVSAKASEEYPLSYDSIASESSYIEVESTEEYDLVAETYLEDDADDENSKVVERKYFKFGNAQYVESELFHVYGVGAGPYYNNISFSIVNSVDFAILNNLRDDFVESYLDEDKWKTLFKYKNDIASYDSPTWNESEYGDAEYGDGIIPVKTVLDEYKNIVSETIFDLSDYFVATPTTETDLLSDELKDELISEGSVSYVKNIYDTDIDGNTVVIDLTTTTDSTDEDIIVDANGLKLIAAIGDTDSQWTYQSALLAYYTNIEYGPIGDSQFLFIVFDENGNMAEQYVCSNDPEGRNTLGQKMFGPEIINDISEYVYFFVGSDTISSETVDIVSTGRRYLAGADPLTGYPTIDINGNQVAPTDTLANLTGETILAFTEHFSNVEDLEVDILLDCDYPDAVKVKLDQIASETRKDCVAILNVPESQIMNTSTKKPIANVYTSMKSYMNSTLPVVSNYSAIYGNYVRIYDPYAEKERWVPATGFVASQIAINDRETFPWFATAGYTRGILSNVLGVAINPKQAERDILFNGRINSIAFPIGEGVVILSQKTTTPTASAFDQLSVRRLFLYMERAIGKFAKRYLFELNDEVTRSRFKNLVDQFISVVQSNRGVKDYLVICDESNNTPTIVENDEFIADILIKPNKSIRYIKLIYTNVAGTLDFSEVVV